LLSLRAGYSISQPPPPEKPPLGEPGMARKIAAETSAGTLCSLFFKKIALGILQIGYRLAKKRGFLEKFLKLTLRRRVPVAPGFLDSDGSLSAGK